MQVVLAFEGPMQANDINFAMLSSGAGNLLRHAQPWSQIVPSSLGIMVMAILLASYLGKRMRVVVSA
jgi:hypothetical protein